MALRPEIALQTQGIKLPDFAGAYESVLNNRARREGLEQNRQLHNAQMKNIQAQEEQRVLNNQRQAKLDQAVQSGDRNAIGLVDPKLRADLDKADTEKAAAERKAQIDQFELASKKADRALKLIGGIADDTTLRAAIGQIQSDPEMSKAVPVDIMLKMAVEGFTPENANTIKQFGMSLLSEKEKLEMARTQQTMRLADSQEARAVEKAPYELKAAKNTAAAGEVDPVTGMTKFQTVTTGLQRDQFGETQRHNRTAEGLQAQGVNIQRQKMDMDKIEKQALAKGMSQESAKVFAIAETALPEIKILKEALSKSPRGSVLGILSGTDTNLSRIVDNVADKVGRIRSGGAINKDEAERFKGQIVRMMDLQSGDPGPAIDALTRIEQEFNTVAAQMKPGGKAAATQGPKVGTVEDGHVFLGGNPADPKSWKKQ